MNDESIHCILQNQIEIMGALSLLLRYAKPSLIGNAGELDVQRDDLLQRHKITQRALAHSIDDAAPPAEDVRGRTIEALRAAKEFADDEFSDSEDLNRKNRISRICDKIDRALQSQGDAAVGAIMAPAHSVTGAD